MRYCVVKINWKLENILYMNGLFFALFMVFVVVMLVLDLFVFHKKDHVIGIKEATVWTAIWIAMALVFAVLIYFFGDWMMPMPADTTMTPAEWRLEMTQEYLAGYFLEKSLSIDNIFVMIMIFVSFGIKKEYYHRVLFWGIFGAIVMRFIFIFALGALIAQFAWLLAVFGVILIYSGIKMFRDKGDEPIDTSEHPVVKFASKHFPVTKESYGHDFFHAGKMTPLFLVLLVIEFSDIIFAVDSIPAVFSVSTNTMVVFTSNIFAIMGLRSLFFLLSDVADRFWLLHYGLGALLCFIGIKMIGATFFHWHIPTMVSLGIILGILVVSIVLSMLIKKPTASQERP